MPLPFLMRVSDRSFEPVPTVHPDSMAVSGAAELTVIRHTEKLNLPITPIEM